MDSNIYDQKRLRKEDYKSAGIQATITYNSRATSPFTSVDYINNRDMNHDENVPFATLLYPDMEYLRYEILPYSDFIPTTKYYEVLQNLVSSCSLKSLKVQ